MPTATPARAGAAAEAGESPASSPSRRVPRGATTVTTASTASTATLLVVPSRVRRRARAGGMTASAPSKPPGVSKSAGVGCSEAGISAVGPSEARRERGAGPAGDTPPPPFAVGTPKGLSATGSRASSRATIAGASSPDDSGRQFRPSPRGSQRSGSREAGEGRFARGAAGSGAEARRSITLAYRGESGNWMVASAERAARRAPVVLGALLAASRSARRRACRRRSQRVAGARGAEAAARTGSLAPEAAVRVGTLAGAATREGGSITAPTSPSAPGTAPSA
ncbi:hypothetical protein ABXS69_08885 [Actinomyces timonensis]|uniref:Uncharacterized protein n=1 Tax=Actinomyces timonensis TaxID=1288391 RepID=A0AAU8N0M3_9ACTO